MSTTAPDRPTHERAHAPTLILPSVEERPPTVEALPPFVDAPLPEAPHPEAPHPETPDQHRPAPRRSTALLWILVGLTGLLVVLLAVLIPTRTSTPPAPTPTTPPTLAPTPTPLPTPTPPAAPQPLVVFGEEVRARWDVTGIAAGGRLDVHTGPGSHTEILTTLPHDLTALQATGRTARVDGVPWRELEIPGDGTGWVEAGHLTRSAPAPTAPQVVYGTEAPGRYDVTGVGAGDALNVRSGPGTTHAIVAALARDATGVESTGRIAWVDGAPWREVRLPGDGTGWVSAAFLAPTPSGPRVVHGQEPRANWDVTGIAAGAVLDVHQGPGAGTPVVAALAADAAELESTGRIADVDGARWRELVIPGDGTGWVDAAHLVETPPPPTVVYGQEPPGRWDVTDVPADEVLTVRTGPGAHTTVLTALPADATQLESTGRIADVDGERWRELVIPDDGTGWVDAAHLVESPPPPQDPQIS